MQKTIDDMTKFHKDILDIFDKISSAPADRRIKYIDMTKEYMRALEKKTREHSDNLEASAQKIKKACNNTIPLDTMEQKLESLMLKFMQRKHR